MVNKYTLGGAVLSIFLLAIFGVNRAMSWLTQSTADAGAEDRIVAVNASDNNGGISPDGQSGSQAGENGNMLPLEEAGTYIQRQQSIGEDAAVSGSTVAINPSTNDSFTTAQSDTVVDPQPTQPEVVNDPAPAPAPATSATPSSPAVPALW